MSWKYYNLWLTPVHDWIHDCIWEWTREWYSSLSTSTVWPNCSQVIIAMLSGRAVGLFCNPSQGKRMKLGTLGWCLKALLPCFLLPQYFWFPRISPLPIFDGLTIFRQTETKNTGYAWLRPSCGLFKWPRCRLSIQF